MFASFFKDVLLRISIYLRRFLAPAKHKIHRVMLEYDTSGEPCDSGSAFWVNESRFWEEDEFEENETNITWIYKNRLSIDPVPSCVSNIAFRVTYEHDGKVYKYVTRDMNHHWPPKKTPGFHPLIKEAWAVMYDGDRMNVTDKVKKYAGPYSDFHGETLKLSDVVGEQCVSVQITNIMGQTCSIKLGESFSRKTLWTS